MCRSSRFEISCAKCAHLERVTLIFHRRVCRVFPYCSKFTAVNLIAETEIEHESAQKMRYIGK